MHCSNISTPPTSGAEPLFCIDNVDILLVADPTAPHPWAFVDVFAQYRPLALVWTAASATQALDYLRGRGEFTGRDDRSQPRLVVLRWAMASEALPLLRAIRNHAGTCTVPVVILTADPDNEALRRCYAAGANSVVAETADLGAMANLLATLQAFWMGVNEPPHWRLKSLACRPN